MKIKTITLTHNRKNSPYLFNFWAALTWFFWSSTRTIAAQFSGLIYNHISRHLWLSFSWRFKYYCLSNCLQVMFFIRITTNWKKLSDVNKCQIERMVFKWLKSYQHRKKAFNNSRKQNKKNPMLLQVLYR